MSRIGNKSIQVPQGVTVTLEGQKITVTGPKGTLEREIHKNITVTVENNETNGHESIGYFLRYDVGLDFL